MKKTSGTQTLTSATKTLNNITKNGAGTLQLLDDLTTGSTNTFTLNEGTFDTGNFLVSLGIFTCTGTNAVSIIEPGTGTILITLSGSGTTIATFTNTNATLPNVVLFTCSYSGSTGTRTLDITNSNISVSTTGSDIVTFTANNIINALTFTGGFSGTWSNVAMTIHGNLTISASTTVGAGANKVTLAGSGTATLTTNNRTLDFPVRKTGTGTRQLASNVTMGATRTFEFDQGTLDINTRTLTVPANMSCIIGASNSASLSFSAAGKIVLSGSGNVWEVFRNAGATFTTTGANLGIIDLTSSSAKNFIGGSGSYPTINQGGAGALTILDEGTYYDITNSVQPATVIFESTKTNTFTNDFNLSGTSGNLITIQSTISGSQSTLSKTSGTVSVSHCSIKDSNATGGATWEAYTSNGNVDAGNNTGWIFSSSTYPGYIGMMIFY